MIPLLNLTTFNLGPLTLQVWGLFVAVGFLAAGSLAYYRAQRTGLEGSRAIDLTFWILLGAMLGGRLLHVLAYEPAYYAAHLMEVLRIWQGGMSSVGGLFGGGLAAYLYIRKYQLPWLRWADALTYALPLGWVIGRLGCAVTHHHWGIPCTGRLCALAIVTPNGQYHDLSLYEALFWVAALVTLGLLGRKLKREGVLFTTTIFAYAIFRLLTDFWRLPEAYGGDARYLGLTPAQYFAIAGMGLCLWWWRGRIRPRVIPSASAIR